MTDRAKQRFVEDGFEVAFNKRTGKLLWETISRYSLWGGMLNTASGDSYVAFTLK